MNSNNGVNFDEENAVNIIASTFQDEASAYIENYKCTFNPIDKLVELFEENKKLYERILHAEREEVELMQQMLDKK